MSDKYKTKRKNSFDVDTDFGMGNSGMSKSSGAKLQPAGWFAQHLSRRSLGKGMIWMAVLGAAGITVYKYAAGDDSEIPLDSLELQKKEGWNVGAVDQRLDFQGQSSVFDSQNKAGKNRTDMNYLLSVYTPKSDQWKQFFVPTLIQSLAQPKLKSELVAIHTAQAQNAYMKSEGLRNLISQAQNKHETLIISDLPGPESVAVGAALADTATLIPDFGNWPHPQGNVPSHQTLGSMIYYAGEIEEKSKKLPANAPAAILLDSNRLNTTSSNENEFDNRYMAQLPSVDELKKRGIKQILYLTPDKNRKDELDDINDDFVKYENNGINIKMLPMSEFKQNTEQTLSQAGVPTNTSTPHYYYGGSPMAHWWFYSHYAFSPPIMMYDRYSSRPIPRSYGSPSNAPPSYRPVSRPTVFSASKVGTSPGASGVGKSRPTGFGRTSVRMGSDGRVQSTRPSYTSPGTRGRSSGWGSWGRSSGGGGS